MKKLILAALFAAAILLAGPGATQLMLSYGGNSGRTNWVSSQSLGTARNDYGSYVGVKVTIGASNVDILALGRWCKSGNTQTHAVKLFDESGTELVSVTVDCAGVSDAWKFEDLGSPYTAIAGTVYYLESLEDNGGDIWYADDSTFTVTSVAAATDSAYNRNNDAGVGANHMQGPVNFQY